MSLLTAHLKELIVAQITQAQEHFVTHHCQIADSTVEEMYADEQGEDVPLVLVSISLDCDDGRTRMLYLEIDTEDESHVLINKKDFDDGTEDFEDWNDLVDEL